MKDELGELFRDRFAGHEAPVDPGAWQAIQAKLSAGAAGGDDLQELFQERFATHESPVDPSVWTNVSSQLGHGVAATSGSSFMGGLGWAAAGVGVLAVAGAVYLFSADPTAPEVVVEQHAVVITSEVPNDRAEEARTDTPVPSPRTEQGSDPIADDVVQPSRPNEASRPERNNLVSGLEPSAPAAPEELLPELIEPAIAAKPEGPAIVEGIISQLTEQVKADVESKVGTQAKPDAGTPSDERTNGESEPELEHPAELPQLYLQNIFTPNSDGVNDTYSAVVDPEAFDRIMLRIYDVRNNRLVFSTDTNEPWTGDGCPDGYYLVAVEAVAKDGRLVTQGKVVWLNRTPMN